MEIGGVDSAIAIAGGDDDEQAWKTTDGTACVASEVLDLDRAWEFGGSLAYGSFWRHGGRDTDRALKSLAG